MVPKKLSMISLIAMGWYCIQLQAFSVLNKAQEDIFVEISAPLSSTRGKVIFNQVILTIFC